MSWNSGAVLTRGTIVLVLAVGVVALMLTAGLAGTASTAARGTTTLTAFHTDKQTIIVKPNGVDDTADIQAAFNACVSYGPGCTVQLEKGTYYTSQITVFGFQGNFVGMGQGLTTIQALPNLPAPTADPFWAALPGPANPWPALFTFENGAYRISGMTLTEPYTNAISPSWDATAAGGPAIETELFTAMELTGLRAYATVDHVTVLGTAGNVLGTNIYNAITFEGSVLPTGWTDPITDVIPISGAFSMTNSVFNSAESGPWVDVIANARVTVCDNTLVNSPVPLGFADASNSQITFCGNQASNVYSGAGLLVEQSTLVQDQRSTVFVTGNDFHVNDGANAVDLFDFGAVSTLSAVVSGNVFQTDTSCGCYVGTEPNEYSAIISEYLGSLDVSGNTFLGGGAAGVYVVGGPAIVSGNTILGSYAGVWVDHANHVWVAGNVIKNSAAYGIAVTDGSSYNTMAWNVVKNSGLDDLYWDGTGTGNVWFGNVCQTSSPPGLC
jgi:hypothetical protein